MPRWPSPHRPRLDRHGPGGPAFSSAPIKPDCCNSSLRSPLAARLVNVPIHCRAGALARAWAIRWSRSRLCSPGAPSGSVPDGRGRNGAGTLRRLERFRFLLGQRSVDGQRIARSIPCHFVSHRFRYCLQVRLLGQRDRYGLNHYAPGECVQIESCLFRFRGRHELFHVAPIESRTCHQSVA